MFISQFHLAYPGSQLPTEFDSARKTTSQLAMPPVSHSIFVVFYPFAGIKKHLFGFFLVVHQPCDAETNTYPHLSIPLQFLKLTFGRMPILTTRSRASTFQKPCTVVEEWHLGYFCLGYFTSPTHHNLATLMARKVWRLWVLVFAHDRFSCQKLHVSPFEDCPILFPPVTNVWSSFNSC